MFHGKINRRAFFRYGLMTAECCILDSAFNAWPVIACSDYYSRHRNDLLAAFAQTNQGAGQYLSATQGQALAREVCAEAAQNFRKLLPGLPDVGGEQNLMTEYVAVAAWYVAYYRPFLRRGLSAEQLGRMIYNMDVVQFGSQPPAQLSRQGRERCSPAYLAKMERWAAWTQQRRHPANWVAQFLRGDGRNFDYGYNYSQCALVKYFKAQDALPAAPYVCINDFIRSKAYGTGLQRQGTLAMGYPVCDFRYKQGRPVTQGWQSELAKIKRTRP